MTMQTGFYFNERCLWHTTGEQVLFMPVGGYLQPPSGSGHAENPETKRRLKNLVDVSGLGKKLKWLSAPSVTRTEMERIHSRSYLDRFKAVSDAGGGEIGYDSPFGPGSFEIAAISAGLVKQAASDVFHRRISNAYVISRPPGHHALPDTSMGFCLLANIPIALEALRAERGPTRIAVVDWDVHHGNGTEACFYDRNDTLTISLHQENCFPTNSGAADDRGKGDGLGYNLNIPLLPGGGHQSYIDAFEMLVAPALKSFEPELIVVASGLDANSFDPLARMQAHSETFRAMAQRIMALADELCQGRLVMAHEGGYSEAYVPFCGHAIIETMAVQRTDVVDPFLEILVAQQPTADFVTLQRVLLNAQAQVAGLV